MELYKLKDFYSQKKQKEGSHTRQKKKNGIVIARLLSFSKFSIDAESIKQIISLVLIR